MYFDIALIAYFIDRVFGEFKFISFYKHPVIFMGEYISWFENNFYKDSFIKGVLLTLSLLFIVFCISYPLSYLPWYIEAIIASTAIASKMLYDSVKDIIDNPQNIQYLVSRDTENLSESDINKAAIETYAENLSDGVIAPIFYLSLFGICGVFIYKAINTLDSMIGYKNDRYNNFGKFSAKLDDIVNFIPSRLTAILIAGLFFSKKALLNFYDYGKKSDSPNAGHPISAMALALDLKLGGNTSYFKEIKSKPYFGDGRKDIETNDILQALSLQQRVDILLISLLLLTMLI
jgi:adenosylcobinamide-phosphate synthase